MDKDLISLLELFQGASPNIIDGRSPRIEKYTIRLTEDDYNLVIEALKNTRAGQIDKSLVS